MGCRRFTVFRLMMFSSLKSRYSWISSNTAPWGFSPSRRFESLDLGLMLDCVLS